MKLIKDNRIKGQRGFTLIEIIAVLVILGILSAVAIPKYMDLQDSSRIKAAQAAVSEAKARCSSSYAKILLENNGNVNATSGANILATGNIDTGNWGDYNVTLANNTGNNITITVDKVKTVSLGANVVVENWVHP